MTIHTFTNSSQLNIGHYYEEDHTLCILFSTGKTYEYSGVPIGAWDQLIAAESAGKYFNQYIKGKYEYKLVS